MPKENRKRGRRDEQKKRKREHADEQEPSKRHRKSGDDYVPLEDEVPYPEAALNGVTYPGEMPFYGMLDEEEQNYFRQADEQLELNQFEGPEDRALFLESVYREADGKELKIANSQSCSRLMERLIILSTPEQLKGLFQRFSGQYVQPVLRPTAYMLTTPAFSILSNIASPPTAAKRYSSMLRPSSPKS
jgi:nucleolar protein 9